MKTVPVHEAKSMLSQLVERAAKGETILIGGHGKPEAALTSAKAMKPKKRIGLLRGKFKVPDDFDDPLPEELLELFEGGT